MIRFASKLGLLAATLFALAPVSARAEEPDALPGSEEGEEPAGADLAPAAGAASTTAAVDASAPTRWPRDVIMRPLTLPSGVVMVGMDPAANNDFSAVSTTLVAGYGISDKLEAVLFYGYGLKDFEIKGDLKAGVGYAALRGAAGGKLEVVPRAVVGYSLLGEALTPLGLGAQVQYNISDKLAVITPGGQLAVSLAEDAAMATPITFGLQVAVGFQPTPELYLQLDTNLATFSIADSANAFIFADRTPASLLAVYNAIPALDVAAGIGLDLTPAAGGVADTLAFLLGVRYYAGSL